ncbi:MAG: DUF58 domain-containing protein [Lachnospiraceae bacterium]|nr:DUF58 domain-containing protein [Lachnospiraceae bacterium]MCM1239894.1 DUF58 domain-containing protein [Lachnospiraceae bacterium]
MRKYRLFFLCLWVLSLAAISFFGGVISYGFFFGMCLLPVISLIYILCVYLHFKIYQELGNRNMVCGQPEDYFFILQNENSFAFTGVSVRLFSRFSYVEELPGDEEYELLPGDKFTYRTRLVCRYRGEYEVGVKEVVVTDFLRLFRVRYANPGAIKALVRPKLVQLEELRGLEEFQVPLRRETLTGAEPDILVRTYMEGDPLRQIHWKATAREGKLLSRLSTGEEKQGISIFCDMTRFGRKAEEYLPLENKMLETFLALGYFFARKDMDFTACYEQGGPVCTQVRGMKDFDGFYQGVAEVRFEEKGDFPDLVGQALARGGLWDSGIAFLVLHEPDAGIMEITRQLAAAGMAVVIYAVTDRDIREYEKQGDGRRRIIQIPIEEPLERRL